MCSRTVQKYKQKDRGSNLGLFFWTAGAGQNFRAHAFVEIYDLFEVAVECLTDEIKMLEGDAFGDFVIVFVNGRSPNAGRS